jgi:hypothetical protein
MAKSNESRRTFLGAFLRAAGIGGGALLVACQAESEAYRPGTVVAPAEVVVLQSWMHYANQMPERVPSVRLLPTAGSIYAQ